MAVSQNGWPALQADSKYLTTINIPTKQGVVRLRLRGGSAGFLLAHMILWWADRVEPVIGKILDDWGYAYRPIREGQTLSNHSSGTAADVNATRWPLGTDHMPAWMKVRIRARLLLYRGCIRWGGDYHYRLDQMHLEINKNLTTCEKRARRLMRSPRGRRILAVNPGLREWILS